MPSGCDRAGALAIVEWASRSSGDRRWWRLLPTLFLLVGCAGRMDLPSDAASGPGVTPPRDALPLEEATVRLAEATLAGARTAPNRTEGRRKLVIDPLIDRATGAETAATRVMVARIETLVRERYPEFDLQPFTVAALDEQPLILLGSINGAAAPGSFTNVNEPTATYRIWAVLADLRSNVILSHPSAWVRADTVDATPTPFFRDSPVFTADEARAAYLRTCALDPGQPVDPAYLSIVRAQAVTADAVLAYESGRPATALALYRQARFLPGGEQQRVLNGIYLANRALNRPADAEAAFADIVEYGLSRDRLAVKLLFRPASANFLASRAVSGPYPMWIRQIATVADRRQTCLGVTGHTSRTGSAIGNDRLSLLRAQRVRAGLVAARPPLSTRTQAEGRGSRHTIVGLGTDDLRDALDRRVEFSPAPCPTVTARAPG